MNNPLFKKNWATNFKKNFNKAPFFIILAIITVFLSQIFIVFEGIDKINKFYNSTFGSNKNEEKIINSLSVWVNIDMFKKILGTPVFINKRGDKSYYFEYIFFKNKYWVQAITDEIGTVMFYAVTSCNENFKPKIKDPSDPNRVIILNKSKFENVSSRIIGPERYFFGVTANSYIFENESLGNPGNYLSIYWGVNDTCPVNGEFFKYIDFETSDEKIDLEKYKEFRKFSTFNTFAVSAPFDNMSEVFNYFQIGVDRIQARVYSK